MAKSFRLLVPFLSALLADILLKTAWRGILASFVPTRMIRVKTEENGEVLSIACPISVWGVETALKRHLRIPRGQQALYLGSERLPPKQMLTDGATLMLFRISVVCRSCGRGEDFRQEHRFCTGCCDARYCNEKCQKNDWKRHRSECGQILRNT